jgi:tetratricopeptide (TPR) repeat protein
MSLLCLNMIVKNESKIIERLLNSVINIIDFYCICDTGSTDDTKNIIENYFRGRDKHGIIFDEPFKDFGYNRSVALDKCFKLFPAAEFVLLLDADMELVVGNFNKKETLARGDFFSILQGNLDFYYQNVRIVRNDGKYKYLGVTHEYIDRPQGARGIDLPKETLFIKDIGDGGAKSDKFARDIRLLTKGLEEEPNNGRYHFYIANSFYDNGDYLKAIEYYLQRIKLGGWIQEVWYSYYRLGLCYKNAGEIEKAISTWLDAFDFYKYRLENIYEIVYYYRCVGKQKIEYEFIKIARAILEEIVIKNIDIDSFLFLHKDIYSYKFEYEFSIIASWIGIKNISDNVVAIFNGCRDQNIITNTLTNMKFYDFRFAPRQQITFPFDVLTYKFNNGKIVNFKSSSSSILFIDGKFHMNVRYVNYRMDKKTGSYFECDSEKPISESKIISINSYVVLNNNFSIISEKIFEQKYEERLYIGVEDLKLWRAGEWIKFIGTGYHASNKIGIVNGIYGRYSNEHLFTEESLEAGELQPPAADWSCEKNWVFLKDDIIIYKWSPLTLCSLENTKLKITSKYAMPLNFRHVRGSTNACDIGKFNLFICHIVSYESPRHYYHMFVLFDKEMAKCRFSAPFKFDNEAIEYCIGLTIRYDDIVVAYSTWDNSTNISVFPLNKVLDFCKHDFDLNIFK